MINYDVSEYNRLNSDLYRKEKRNLQIEFLKLQNWAIKEGKKIAVVFEGRDAAGKTDTINLLARHLIPDHFRYVHLGIPTENESKKAMLHRYVSAGAFGRYQSLKNKTNNESFSMDIALPRNEVNWLRKRRSL